MPNFEMTLTYTQEEVENLIIANAAVHYAPTNVDGEFTVKRWGPYAHTAEVVFIEKEPETTEEKEIES